MDLKRCAACRKKFRKRPQALQTYCSADKCQRERRRCWQQTKRATDPDYKDNQSRAQQAWAKRNANYWAEYRQVHPEYNERNRKLQRERNGKRKRSPIAKMDVSAPKPHMISGTYLLIPALVDGIAKMDAWTAEIRFISSSYDIPNDDSSDCKERTQ